jgi:hypothetical protein
MVLTRRTERKIKDVRGENRFGYRRKRGTSGAIGMLTVTSERTLWTYTKNYILVSQNGRMDLSV